MNIITKKTNLNALIKTLKKSCLYGELGQEFYSIYVDPYLANGLFHIGEKKSYNQLMKIFLDEIIFYKEFYFNCDIDLDEEMIDLEDEVQVLYKVICYDRIFKGWCRIIDLHILR